MFAIGIRYLCGWAMATHPADRERPKLHAAPPRPGYSLRRPPPTLKPTAVRMNTLLW